MTRIEKLETKVKESYLDYLSEVSDLKKEGADYIAKEEAYKKYQSKVRDLESEIASLGGVI